MLAELSRKLIELDRLVNDPNVLLDAARVWDLLDQLSTKELNFDESTVVKPKL